MNSSPIPSVVSVSPNPFRDHFTVYLNASTGEVGYCFVYDVNGYSALSKDFYLEPGWNELDFQMDFAPPGIYYLKCLTANSHLLAVVRLEKN